MAWRQVHIGQILESVGYFVSFDFMKKLTKNTFRYIANWMGRVARAKREVVNKRLRRRRKRLDSCRMLRRSGPCRCNCIKCSSYRYVQRNRVLEPDYLANLAYEHRINLENPIMDELKTARSPEPDEENHEKRQDNRDLQPSEYGDVVWWTNVNHRVQMPPLLNNLPTRSNCSSTSGFRSGTPEILDSSEPTINTSDSSDSSYYQSCRESSSSPRQVHITSKSESRMRDTGRQKTRVTCASRSASMPLGDSPNNQRCSLLASKSTEKSNKRKKRPVSSKTTTSHACDHLSTCVKCSKINSRPCKRITR